jgi:hypothetical protein
LPFAATGHAGKRSTLALLFQLVPFNGTAVLYKSPRIVPGIQTIVNIAAAPAVGSPQPRWHDCAKIARIAGMKPCTQMETATITANAGGDLTKSGGRP